MGFFRALSFPPFGVPFFPCLFPLYFFRFLLYSLLLLYLYFVISLLPSCFMFGMLVIRRLLGILTFLRVLLLTQLLRIVNFEFAVSLLIMLGISGPLMVFFVKLARMTRFLFCFNFIYIFFFRPGRLNWLYWVVSCFLFHFYFSFFMTWSPSLVVLGLDYYI